MTDATPVASTKKTSTSPHPKPGTHGTRPFCPKWGEPRTHRKARSIRAHRPIAAFGLALIAITPENFDGPVKGADQVYGLIDMTVRRSYSAICLFVLEQQSPALHRLPCYERWHAENHIRNSLDQRQPERGFGRPTEHNA